jgi:L-asparaginase II
MLQPSHSVKVHSPTAESAANPLVVEVTRGGMVESRHRAAVAVVDADGKVVRGWGDFERPVYGRSAIKPLQALPLVESGAADRFGVTQKELALACASHSGEKQHVDAVAAWLARIGLDAGDLECGSHLPIEDAAMQEFLRSGAKLTALYNNCSGKHTGFLATALHQGEPTRGYIRYEHPVQQRILGVLEQMCGLDLGGAARGIDGCGIPVIAIPLGNMALGMARLADPADLPAARAAAARRIVAAMTAEPFMVAGSRRFCTVVMAALGAKAAIKTGAEGVYCAALPELGLGVAIKVDDGAGRAAEVAMGEVLLHLGVIDEQMRRRLADCLSPPILNRAGLETGRVRPASESPF